MGYLEDFLQARIAEDAAVAESLPEPARDRMLATLDANRRLVAMIRPLRARNWNDISNVTPTEGALWDVLTLLALPYATHPDYSSDYLPTGQAEIEPEPNLPIKTTPIPRTIGTSQAEQRAYLQVAVALAQSVAAHDPTTPEEWWNATVAIGNAWSNEPSTELILSRGLLAMTRLAVAAAKLIADNRTAEVPADADVQGVLASIPEITGK